MVAVIVGGDLGVQTAVVVAFLMDDDILGQAHGDVSVPRRPPHWQAGDGKHAVWQRQDSRVVLDSVAHVTDGATSQAHAFSGIDEHLHRQRRIHGGVHERVGVVVGVVMAAQVRKTANTPHVAQERQKHGRVGDPRHGWDQVGNGLLLRLLPDHNDGILLQIGFRRRRLGAGQKQVQQPLVQVTIVECSAYSVAQQAHDGLVQIFSLSVRLQAVAVLEHLGEIRHATSGKSFVRAGRLIKITGLVRILLRERDPADCGRR